MKSDSLRNEYIDAEPNLIRLKGVMVEQVDRLVSECGLTLGVPIESRVKDIESVAEKIEKKGYRFGSLDDVEDLVGIRVIFLFQRDVEKFHEQISKSFVVSSSEDTEQRLGDSQFGYKSRHYTLRMPHSWEDVPSLRGLTGRAVEVQVRTLAQHIWAAASHKLQYKREESVPLPLKRSINRVSALLETVDLEFSRVLVDRDQYVDQLRGVVSERDRLNVDILESVLDEYLPKLNKDEVSEGYSNLLEDLLHFGVETRGDLISLLTRRYESIMDSDRRRLLDDFDEEDFEAEKEERLLKRRSRGVFFTHVGLTREALSEEFGTNVVRDLSLIHI